MSVLPTMEAVLRRVQTMLDHLFVVAKMDPYLAMVYAMVRLVIIVNHWLSMQSSFV